MKILVPIDESVHSKKALEKAKELAVALGAEVTILNVQNAAVDLKYMHNKAFYDELNKNISAIGREILDEGLMVFSDFNGNIKSISKNGDTASEIISLAEEGKFDLIIMGSRGAGIFSRTLLGSVSDKVVHHIKTSVLIVK